MALGLNKPFNFLAHNIFWIVLGIFIGLSAVKAYGTWWFIQQSVFVPHLVDESTFQASLGAWWNILKFAGVFLFGGGLHFTIPWFISGVYLLLWFEVRRPCIDISGGKG